MPELFSLKSLAGKKLPTIIMAHGWGGTASGFRRDALDFANAGYLVILFDYKGWGESDARLILTKTSPITPMPGQNQKITVEVTEQREYVDPLEQTEDWFNVINWAVTEPMVRQGPDRDSRLELFRRSCLLCLGIRIACQGCSQSGRRF